MSITATLSNALSGLTAASRAAQLVSSNVSNAMTEGYARRELELSARAVTGAGDGVQIDGIRRIVDEALLRDRRLADSALGAATVRSEYQADVLGILGIPGEPGSLSDLVGAFDAALVDAAAKPDSEVRLAAILDGARSLVAGLNDASEALQQLRVDADAGIAAEVDRLNEALRSIADLNAMVLRSRSSGEDLPGLLDQRQVLIDEVSRLVPVRQIARDNGTIALYTLNGARLVDATVANVTFQPTEPITADMTLASGALGSLTVDGEPVSTDGETSPFAGGSIWEKFNVRDVLAPSNQAALDSLTVDLISRFEDPAVDPTLTLGDAGLFTDGSGALNLSDTVGLASRIGLNAAVDPAAGGALWRLRDGIGATLPGAAGDSRLLTSLREALSVTRPPVVPTLGSASRSVAGLAADVLSHAAQAKLAADQTRMFETVRQEALADAERANGVDTDQEMQKLLLIEQAYAANARVVQTADRLINLLLEI